MPHSETLKLKKIPMLFKINTTPNNNITHAHMREHLPHIISKSPPFDTQRKKKEYIKLLLQLVWSYEKKD